MGPMVRERRKSQALRIDEAAGLLGVSVDLISRLENRQGSVRLDKAMAVLDGLGLTLRVLPKDPPWARLRPAQDTAAEAGLPVNEHSCMSLARRMGLPAAEASLLRTPRPVLRLSLGEAAADDVELVGAELLDRQAGLAFPGQQHGADAAFGRSEPPSEVFAATVSCGTNEWAHD